MDEKQDVFKVGGMMCAGCASGVEKILLGIDGVSQANVKLDENNVSVSYNMTKTSFSAMRELLAKSNFNLSES